MSSVQNLRELINQRLTAAAEEIFTEFEKTIVQYEEEIDRQRRLLDNIWKPEIKLHTTDHLQQYVQEENVLAKQNVCNQERNSSVDQEDPEPPQMKEEQEELCTSQEGEHLVLMQEADTLVQRNSKCEEISGEIFGLSDKRFSQLDEDIDYRRRQVDMIWKPRIMLHRIDHQHQDVCKEGNGLANQQLCNKEKKFRLDREEAEPSEIKEEEEELCTSQQGKQIVMKQATDTFLSTSTDMDNDLSELEPNSNHLLSYNSPVTVTPHQEGSEHVDSCSTRIAALKPKSHSSCNVAKSSLSEHHCDVGTSEKSIKCDVFGNIFKYQIKKHHQIHKGVKPNACIACRKSFSSWSQQKVHMKIHTGEKRYSCETCGKRFSHGSHLTVHMRTHTGERPYSCQTCGKSFSERGKLTVHMRTHTGERPYSCGTCGKSFSYSGSLTVHMRVHTGERPYSCERCGKSFSQGSHLISHRRTHTGEKLSSWNNGGNKA
ncbi:zinc finger protein 391-like [Amphiprion ocellaris]|uniref:zinc finger protein 391-like n=1 Tax=Amphiprion ocellaris TaxID=80972 RepID=UPI000C31AE66|nr:zinc finger protein 391-like [Amphiprion ocellaris]